MLLVFLLELFYKPDRCLDEVLKLQGVAPHTFSVLHAFKSLSLAVFFFIGAAGLALIVVLVSEVVPDLL